MRLDLLTGDVIRSQHLGVGVSCIDARYIADVAVEALVSPQVRSSAWELTSTQARRRKN